MSEYMSAEDFAEILQEACDIYQVSAEKCKLADYLLEEIFFIYFIKICDDFDLDCTLNQIDKKSFEKLKDLSFIKIKEKGVFKTLKEIIQNEIK